MNGPLVGSLYTVSNPGIRICVHVFVEFLTGPAFRIGKVFVGLKLRFLKGALLTCFFRSRQLMGMPANAVFGLTEDGLIRIQERSWNTALNGLTNTVARISQGSIDESTKR